MGAKHRNSGSSLPAYFVEQASGPGLTVGKGSRPLHAVAQPRMVTAANTRVPPTKAHIPGASPVNKNTHMGLISGSIDGIKTASSARTRLMA